jgi:hypothetical protein
MIALAGGTLAVLLLLMVVALFGSGFGLVELLVFALPISWLGRGRRCGSPGSPPRPGSGSATAAAARPARSRA